MTLPVQQLSFCRVSKLLNLSEKTILPHLVWLGNREACVLFPPLIKPPVSARELEE